MISIHAPREGSDDLAAEVTRLQGISIHAPREGSDLFFFFWFGWLKHFNPRSP